MDDNDIIALFFARSEDAIAELAGKYGHICERVACGILNDKRDAEECVNDAYLGAWNTIPPEKPNPLLSYVCRIVRNLAVNRYHANRAQKRNSVYDIALDELEQCFPAADCVEDEFDAREVARLIDEFLSTLDSENRILFVRRYWHSESIASLATLFQTSRHNISVRLARVREKLRAWLIQKGVSL